MDGMAWHGMAWLETGPWRKAYAGKSISPLGLETD